MQKLVARIAGLAAAVMTIALAPPARAQALPKGQHNVQNGWRLAATSSFPRWSVSCTRWIPLPGFGNKA